MTMYLYCVGGKAIPEGEDPPISDHLYETVCNATEMNINSTEMGKTSTLCLRKE